MIRKAPWMLRSMSADSVSQAQIVCGLLICCRYIISSTSRARATVSTTVIVRFFGVGLSSISGNISSDLFGVVSELVKSISILFGTLDFALKSYSSWFDWVEKEAESLLGPVTVLNWACKTFLTPFFKNKFFRGNTDVLKRRLEFSAVTEFSISSSAEVVINAKKMIAIDS